MIGCSVLPSAWGIMKPPISLYYAWRNNTSAYNKDTVSKSKQTSCKRHLYLYFCSDQRFPYKEGTVLVPQKVSDFNQSQNRSCTTLAEQPRLGTPLQQVTYPEACECAFPSSWHSCSSSCKWKHSWFSDPEVSGSISTDKLSGDVLSATA